MTAPRRWVTQGWVAWREPRPDAALRLFCFPYAGAAAIVYRTWAEALPPSVELCPVELPGRGARQRDPAIGERDALLDVLEAGLEPWLAGRPFAFFGHSMGGMLAHELAVRLRRRGRPAPERLLVSASRPPGRTARPRPVHELPDDRFVAWLRRLGGTPPQVLDDAELMRFLLPTLRADFALSATLGRIESEPLDCPIAAFGGREDPMVAPDALAGWRAHTRASYSEHLFPGGHFYLMSARALLLAELARQLGALAAMLPSGRASAPL